jgi:hypothetical protein
MPACWAATPNDMSYDEGDCYPTFFELLNLMILQKKCKLKIICCPPVCDGNVRNTSGAAVDAVMLDFLEELVAGRKLEISLYYCKLGVIELEAGFLVQYYLHCPFVMHNFKI